MAVRGTSGLAALLRAAKEQERQVSAITEFKLLTDDEKRLILEHVHYPELSKTELADKVQLSRTIVYDFFASSRWEKVNQEFAKRQIKELTQLAIHTLRKSMLFGTAAVKLEAATRVLMANKILDSRNGPSSVKEDNKIVVVWGKDAEHGGVDTLESSAGIETIEIESKAISVETVPTNGDHASILTAPETAGDSRIESQV